MINPYRASRGQVRLAPRVARRALSAAALLVALAACGDTSSTAKQTTATSTDSSTIAATDSTTAATTVAATDSTAAATTASNTATTTDSTTAATSVASVPATTTAAVPELLRFTAPLVGGGEFAGAGYAGRATAFWFWAPT